MAGPADMRHGDMAMDKKSILVAGASRGIGRAIAQRMVQDGYQVIGTYYSSRWILANLAR